MPAARCIDDDRAARHRIEGPGIEDALRLSGQRQQADDNFRARHEFAEPLCAMEDHHAGDVLRRAAPAGDVEIQQLELARGVCADLAHAHDADPAGAGSRIGNRVPAPFGLVPIVAVRLAVIVQHAVDAIFAHPRHEIGIDDARYRNAGRQVAMLKDVVDAHAQRLDQLQVRQAEKQARRRIPDQGGGNVFDIAEFVRIQAHVDPALLPAQHVAPFGEIGVHIGPGGRYQKCHRRIVRCRVPPHAFMPRRCPFRRL